MGRAQGQNTAGKALIASGVLFIIVGAVVAVAVSPWGAIVAAVGVFDIIIGQLMLRGMLGGGAGPSA